MDIIEQAIQQTLSAGQKHHGAGRLGEAMKLYEKVLAVSPGNPRAILLLGVVAMQSGELRRARELLQQARDMDPDDWEARSHLTTVHMQLDEYDRAIPEAQEAIRLMPSNPRLVSNLGMLLNQIGRSREAIAQFRRARRLAPRDAELHSNMLFQMHVIGTLSPEEILREHREWERCQKPLIPPRGASGIDRDPSRPLRVGYVSPDFRNHPVALFFEPLLAHHDRGVVQAVCYACSAATDGQTARLKKLAPPPHQWREIHKMSDDAAAEQIRRDKIDILVDLAGHTSDNRLGIFVRKPAPVQVAYLGYPSTTGLSVMDYRLTDEHLHPAEADACYSETLFRLPQTFAVYQAPGHIPQVKPLPALSNGYVTFGCLANSARLNEANFETWAKILLKVESSRLLLTVAGLEHNPLFHSARTVFAKHGIGAERVQIHGRLGMPELFALHHQIDIGLDSFPQSGHTMVCHALWLGVPMVCLTGRTCWSRLATSVVRNVGLGELAADSMEGYVARAIELARDVPKLAELRGSLRQRMRESAVGNYAQFARHVEGAYRKMWKAWCAKSPA